MHKFDFESVLLIIFFILIISIITYFAWYYTATNFIEDTSSASMYSRPSWYEITEATTSETTEEPTTTSAEVVMFPELYGDWDSNPE